jgi:hypothetical protein
MKTKKGLREIEWGIYAGGNNKLCIYDNGHIPWDEFIARLKEFKTDVPQENIDEVTEKEVQHIRFRPMSPSEARSWGADSGVVVAEEGIGYPVTMVIL